MSDSQANVMPEEQASSASSVPGYIKATPAVVESGVEANGRVTGENLGPQTVEPEVNGSGACDRAACDSPVTDAAQDAKSHAQVGTHAVNDGSVSASGEGAGTTGGDSGASVAPTVSKHVKELEAEGDIAADYLEELLDIADLDGDIDTFTEGDRAHVSIVTDSDVLVGRDGEVLEALQELARLAVMTETGHRSRLMLDVAGHREHRRKELQLLAIEAIDEVKDSGEPVRLEPMNPFERKIVHDVVAGAGLISESEGQEPNRRVVVYLAH